MKKLVLFVFAMGCAAVVTVSAQTKKRNGQGVLISVARQISRDALQRSHGVIDYRPRVMMCPRYSLQLLGSGLVRSTRQIRLGALMVRSPALARYRE